MADTLNTFPTRLREALDATTFTQESLAREIQVALRTVQFWLSGKREPKGRQLVRLAAALDREPSWFYGSDETKVAA